MISKEIKAGRKVRVAMVGAGAMANSVHYPSLASIPEVTIAGICDLNPQRLKETADKYHVEKRFGDYRKMIEETTPDGVYVIGPPHHMYDIWLWCLEQKLPLYIEKPMGLTMHQAEMLAWLAETKGVITQVSHQRRSCPLLVKMREQCLAQGPIVHSVCEFFKCAMQPATFAPGHMMDDCTHAIDTVRWMCGGEVAGVESHCRRIGTPDINWIGITLHFDNGSTGYIVNNWSSGRRIFRVQMHAPGIFVDAEVEGKAQLYRNGDVTGVTYDTKEVAGSEALYVFGGFHAKNLEFIRSLQTGERMTSSPFSDVLKTMRVAEQVLAQDVLSNRKPI